ncbi:hypothetical protein EV426DRAFT_78661 [Tirmania nivea]|nr:hypothetical protein EV426DRAFT_78661 [Tirmania nivea]
MPPHTNYSVSDIHIEPYGMSGFYNSDAFSDSGSGCIKTGFSYGSNEYPDGNVTEGRIRPLVPGIYAPTVAFFDEETEDLDIDTIKKHAIRLAQAGLHGLVTQGSNGEAVHLSHTERRIVTASTREALDDAGFNNMPIIVGCGSQSIRETIELCHEALLSGGDYAMILPPSYYGALYTPDSQLEFFTKIADQSPVPILIYNYPGAVSGIDLNSDVITKLAKHPNIVGCKLTCGNTGKLGRIAARAPPGFMTMGGSADFTLPALIGGGKGVIGGLANIAPKACVEVFKLYQAGKIDEAEKMQAVIGRGDWAAIKSGVVGTKSCLQSAFKYGGYGRKPLPRPTPEQAAAYLAEFEELLLLEEFLMKGCRQEHIHTDKEEEYPELLELEKQLAE